MEILVIRSSKWRRGKVNSSGGPAKRLANSYRIRKNIEILVIRCSKWRRGTVDSSNGPAKKMSNSYKIREIWKCWS